MPAGICTMRLYKLMSESLGRKLSVQFGIEIGIIASIGIEIIPINLIGKLRIVNVPLNALRVTLIKKRVTLLLLLRFGIRRNEVK